MRHPTSGGIAHLGASLCVFSALAAAPLVAAASTRIACDWSGTITSDPQLRRLYLSNGSELTTIAFNMKVLHTAKSRDRRSDTSCDMPEGSADVHLTDVEFKHKRGDAVRVRYLYMDDAGSRGRSWFEPIDCKKESSTVC